MVLILPRKRGFKVDLPDKNTEWKDKFLFFHLAPGINLPSLRRTSKIPNYVGSLGHLVGFDALHTNTPLDGDLPKKLIPKGEAPTVVSQGML